MQLQKRSGVLRRSKSKDNLFYGNKIQLFVYAEAAKANTNKMLFGTFYLPIKNGFSNHGKTQYSFSGFFVDNVAHIKKCDSGLSILNPKSNILNCSLSKPKGNGEPIVRKKQNILSSEEMSAYGKYAIK